MPVQERESLPLQDRRALKNRLLELMDEARTAKNRGHLVTLVELRDWLRQQRDDAEGWSLALVELTLKSIEVLANSSLPPEEMALRAFVEQGGDRAHDLLARLIDMDLVTRADVATLEEDESQAWKRLEQLGVAVDAGGRYALNRRSLAMARDLLEPGVFRAWQGVQETRAQIALNRLAEDDAEVLLEARLGVTPGQARRHLRRHPFAVSSETGHSGFRREPWKRPDLKPLTPSSKEEELSTPDVLPDADMQSSNAVKGKRTVLVTASASVPAPLVGSVLQDDLLLRVQSPDAVASPLN